MKLTTFLLFVSLFTVEASNYAQNTKITLELKNVTVGRVLNEIELNTDFKFLFNRSDIDISKLVSIKVKKEKVKNILDYIFLDMKVSYKLLNKQIILKSSPVNSNEKGFDLLVDQQKEITGTVTDIFGLTLPGVSIIISGTTKGTQSDFDGKFSIRSTEGEILEFSFIGMKTEKIVVSTSNIINVQLKEDATSLDEVVIIGYGQISKKDLTGAVSSIEAKDFKSVIASDPTVALQGRVAGVSVQSNGGSPGAGVSVLIRGAASITNVDPLYVVDGVFLPSLSSLNPYDVKSIEVLKDASAAAIYGSRAANGVVIVTTLRGRKGGLVVNAHSSLGISTVTNKLNLLNARQYADVSNIAFSSPAPANSTAFDSNIDTDWQKLSLRSGIVQDYGFDISGGGENSSVFFSANYFKEK
jgi:TonB-dependent SusC/RagA subfamily outer membrane receptor